MSDPLSGGRPGEASPFVNRLDTVNEVLDTVRRVRKERWNFPGSTPPVAAEPLRPTLTVFAKNDTGGSLPPFSVVALDVDTVNLVDPSDADDVYAFARQPVFSGTTPAAASRTFGITTDYLKPDQMGRVIVSGVTPVDVVVSNNNHHYARPNSGTTATLTSADAGPAKIIWKESGTGTKRAVIMLTPVDSLAFDTTTSLATHDITADATPEAFGSTLTVPETGNYWVWIMGYGQGNASALGADTNLTMGYLLNGVAQGPPVYLESFVTPVVASRNHRNASLAGGRQQLAAGNTLQLYGQRTAGATWVTAFVSGFLGYMRLS